MDLQKFAQAYAHAWCGDDPTKVAAFFAPNGSLKVNDSEPAVGRRAISEVAQGFMTAFPDMVVSFDRIEAKGERGHFQLDLDRYEHRPRRQRQIRASQRLRGLAFR